MKKKLHYLPHTREVRRGISRAHASNRGRVWIEPLYWTWRAEDLARKTRKVLLREVEGEVPLDLPFDPRNYL